MAGLASLRRLHPCILASLHFAVRRQLSVDLGLRFRVMRFFVSNLSSVGMVRPLATHTLFLACLSSSAIRLVHANVRGLHPLALCCQVKGTVASMSGIDSRCLYLDPGGQSFLAASGLVLVYSGRCLAACAPHFFLYIGLIP